MAVNREEEKIVQDLLQGVSSEWVRQGLARLTIYQKMLADWSEVHNLTALAKQEHMGALLLPSVAVASAMSKYDRVLDLGTGAGIPGFVAALFFPDQQWVLVERCHKKIAFLRQAKHALALDNVQIYNGDFTQMPVDDGIGAIVSRGSAKFDKQVVLTSGWRKQGVPLYSIQTAKSLSENPVGQGVVTCALPDVFQGGELVMVRVL
jgi:16S rRNA (guanine527-N7)-methyltransferase